MCEQCSTLITIWGAVCKESTFISILKSLNNQNAWNKYFDDEQLFTNNTYWVIHTLLPASSLRTCWELVSVSMMLDDNNTLRSRQKCRHYPDEFFKCIFVNETIWISITISLKFVPKDPINNVPALVQIWLGAGPATSHYLNQLWPIYWRIHASLGLNVTTT